MHRKTWGPFSGGQLTAIVCVIAAALLVPVGASAAVKFTNVAITDATGTHRAEVGGGGKLAVGDGSGPLTVDGGVTAKPALPAKPITIESNVLLGGLTTLYGPSSKPFGITSLLFTNVCNTKEEILVESSTGVGSYVLLHVSVAANDMVELTFPAPLVVTPPSGGQAKLSAELYAGTFPCVLLSGVGVQS